MEDLIKRSDAVKVVKKYRGLSRTTMAMLADDIRAVPSADRPSGEWVFVGYNLFKCASCGVLYSTQQLNGLRNYDTDPYAPKYCPNCGAKMKGADDDV